MQKKLDEYESGILIQLVQLMPVQPPAPVADSFEEVNRAQQDKQIYLFSKKRFLYFNL